MSYDFGTKTLGIENPFKTEGKLRALAGLILFVSGLYPLLQVSDLLKTNPVSAYGYAALGFILLLAGSRHLGVGLFQLFRFFVGRSVPTSLAYNLSKSDQDNAQLEKPALMYNADLLHSMMMSRVNKTFIEPIGWVSRFIHTLFKSLLFLPFPIRHIGQEIGSMTINLVVALIAFIVVFFVVSTGLAGAIAQEIAVPILSIVLLIYLVALWRSSANALSNTSETTLHKTSGMSFGAMIGLSILVPVAVGVGLDQYSGLTVQDIRAFTQEVELFSAWGNLGLLFLATLIVIGAIMPAMTTRSKGAQPSTEVAEYRDNMQENVHPNEIFINIENIVLANRRYKEIPNRVYREFDPKLTEQAEGKGSFKGELLIETQPALAVDEGHNLPNKNQKLLISLAAQLMVLVGYGFLSYVILDAITIVDYVLDNNLFSGASQQAFLSALPLLNGALFSLFAWLTFQAAGKALNNASHTFWGELQFTSLLMWMKTEGTYTESRISTGMAITDSTRSENVVVRSSITPWIISSRVLSSIFATSGSANLESPRFILSMTKNEEELEAIKREIKDFLRGRESIASITNEGDLDNAGKIHQVNEQTRAPLQAIDGNENKRLEEVAGGYIAREDSPQ